MRVMIELLLPDDKAETIRDTLEIIAERLSDKGYNPNEWRGVDIGHVPMFYPSYRIMPKKA